MSVKWSWSSNLNRWDLQNALEVAWHTNKSWTFSDLVTAISAALNETFVRSKYANSVSQFFYIECELFAAFIKILFDNWRRFCRPSVIYVPVKCPRGGGIGMVFWPGAGGNLNNKKSHARGVARGGCWSFDLTDTLFIYLFLFHLYRGIRNLTLLHIFQGISRALHRQLCV